MRILFASAQPFLPQIVGGMEVSTLELARMLRRRGHKVALCARIASGGALWLRNRLLARLTGRAFLRDRCAGVDAYRGWDIERGLPEVLARFRPDAVVVQGSTADAFDTARLCLRHGVPTFFYVHDLGPFFAAEPPRFDGLRWIANSAYSQRVLRERLQVDSDLVPPCMDIGAYRVPRGGDAVTMINPRPKKGGPLALELARACADLPFLFVEAWRGSDADVQRLKAEAAALGNVAWLPAQRDMRAVYGRTRLLVVPSQVPETWGRIVTEGQASGIPAVVSDAGALPETAGSGGMVVAADAPLPDWVRAVRSLWGDPSVHARHSAAARALAERPQIAAQQVATDFLAALARGLDARA